MMIEFVIPAYGRPYPLLTIIGSILSQSNKNWKIHVVADGDFTGYGEIKNFFSGIEKIKFTELNGPHNDWGHTPRNYGLKNATEEWVIMTGDDNYYTPNFVDTFLSNINEQTNFIYCDMLHNHETHHTKPYTYFSSQPKINYIDIGNFASRASLAKEIPLNPKSFAADGEFVEEYLKLFCQNSNSIKKINQALYVHN